MRTMLLKGVTVVVILLVAFGAVAQERRELKPILGKTQLRGAWNVTLTPGEGGPPPFQMLMLFTRDGGVVQTDAGPPNPLQFSPGLGEWSWIENDRYSIDYTQLEFDSAQIQIGIFRGHLDVTLDSKSHTISGTARVQFYDATGETLLFEGDGTTSGTRMKF